MRELCRRYGISAETAYKWLRRFKEEGPPGLADRSRRPLSSPSRTPADIEGAVIGLRAARPRWGGRKLARVLGQGAPAPSTITGILRRHGLLDGPGAGGPRDWQRFEADRPNDLWQMDFKGHFAMREGRCHPFDVLDDHSRFALQLAALPSERAEGVRERLERTFRTYGLPLRILADNDPVWCSGDRLSGIAVWLMRLGIGLVHGRPRHPQTQGKLERFHRTLKCELVSGRTFECLDEAQRALDQWRADYNLERPHDALGGQVPASRYEASAIRFPEALPPIEYGPEDVVRKVQKNGEVHFKGRIFDLPRALSGNPVGIRPAELDGTFEVRFMRFLIKTIDLVHNQEGTRCQ